MKIMEGNKIRLRSRVRTIVRGTEMIFGLKNSFNSLKCWDSSTIKLLQTWREGGTIQEFFSQIRVLGGENEHSYHQFLNTLISEGFFEKLDIKHNLAMQDYARWAKTVDFFSEFETDEISRFDYMERLRNSKVLVVGLGGMGSWVLYQLLCLGIGNIYIIDGDRIEITNLNRSILYTPTDVGRWKKDCAIEVAQKFAPTTKVEGHVGYLTSAESLTPYLDGVDLVIGCADQPLWLVQQWIGEACMQKQIPFITGTGGKVGPLCIPGKTACIMCHLAGLIEKNPDLEKSIEIQRELPTGHSGGIVSSGSMAASFIAGEAFRYISGAMKPTTLNSMWGMQPNLTSQIIPVKKHSACKVCEINQLVKSES
ncbi:ThiF family adenylyltransferase [Paenibacillus enshidis]|uniref:ThiF family adenylyltransferase n=1 Tax=Paenibacillus enshidis TaxID=1458439 RepID=A0ABV5AZV2_9BACL